MLIRTPDTSRISVWRGIVNCTSIWGLNNIFYFVKSAVYELNVRETHNHYLLIEAEYARIMKMVDESDMDTFVRE